MLFYILNAQITDANFNLIKVQNLPYTAGGTLKLLVLVSLVDIDI